jgi:glycerate kinase
LTRGIERIIAASDLESELRNADWVVTGEGSLDEQSLRGKVVSGVLEAARRHGVQTAVIAGRVDLDEPRLREAGVSRAMSLRDSRISEREAVQRASEFLSRRARELAQFLES